MVTSRKIRDATWIRQSFLVPTNKLSKPQLNDLDVRNRTFTTARFKFADTTPGGNRAINPPPQFCRNADLKAESIFTKRSTDGRPVSSSGSKGMGIYYSEAIDDNARLVTMRFGVPKFNSLTTFFTGFYNSEAGTLARTGRSTGAIYEIAKMATFIVPLLSPPLLLFTIIGNAWRYLDMKPSSKYYYLKPAMPMYWNAVTSMVNLIAVNKGLIPRFFDENTTNKLDNRYPFTASDMQRFNTLLPDVAMEGGGINVYALATRGQRLARRMYKNMSNFFEQARTETEVVDRLKKIYDEGMNIGTLPSDPEFKGYLAKWLAAKTTQPKNSSPSASSDGKTTPEPKPDISNESLPKMASDVDGWFQFLEAELDDGSAFVSFRVDDSGPVNESFNNTVQESEISLKLNGISGESRSTNFSLANGNISGGLVGSIFNTVRTALGDVVSGVAAGLQMSGLAALGGAAFVDIPKHWQSSVASLPRMTYTFTLTSPYGNKMSQLMNLYIPLCMILAAALPLSTGKQSFTSPFICELYERGRATTRLGMIDSLSINRGVGNLGFNNSGEAMAIEVSFSVVSLSSVMHMPIVQGFSLTNPMSSIFDDDNNFTDYMATLGSLTLEEQVYTGERFKIGITRQMQNMRTWFSAAHVMNWIGDTAPARLASIFYTGAVNR